VKPGLATRDQRGVVRRLCETFRQRIAEFIRMDTLDVWYYPFRAASMLAIADSMKERRRELAVIDKATQQSSRSVMTHATELVNGKLRIRAVPPLMYHIPLESPRDHKQAAVKAGRIDAVQDR
jgi:hypothetical protein